jgi:hypothetical protein
VAKKAKTKAKKDQAEAKGSAPFTGLPPAAPWISMRTGMILVAIASLVMAGLTAWQAIPSQGWVDGILLGLAFGGMIWIIFFGNILVNRFLRRKF